MKKINLPSMASIEERGLKLTTIFKSVVYSFILSIILLAIFSVILTYTNFSESSIPTVVLTVTIISIIYGAQMSAKKARNRGWFIGGVTGIVYIILLYLVSLIFTKRPVFDSHLFVIMLISFGSGSVGGIIGINLKKPEKKYRG